MRTLRGTEFSDEALRSLWLKEMPYSNRNVLLGNKETLEKLATMAFKIIEMTPRMLDLASVQHRPCVG